VLAHNLKLLQFQRSLPSHNSFHSSFIKEVKNYGVFFLLF